jgi:short-subunit dehydrogenase
MLHIMITGASSGLGAALAHTYAAPNVMLTLCGRNIERLNSVAAECHNLGAIAHSVAFDLGNAGELDGRVQKLDRVAPIDIAILNAGLAGTIPAHEKVGSVSHALEIAAVNFTAVVVLATAIANLMVERRRGRIVIVGSVGESFPLAIGPTYCGTKAGIRMFGEALGLRLQRHGVAVTHVSPGFIDTPMSQVFDGPKPFMLTPDASAAIIKRRIEAGATRVVFPWQFRAIRFALLALPDALRRLVLRHATPLFPPDQT